MKVWKQFDTDCSGYIEADELKQFIKALLTKRKGTNLTEEKLIEYTDTIVCLNFNLIIILFIYMIIVAYF